LKTKSELLELGGAKGIRTPALTRQNAGLPAVLHFLGFNLRRYRVTVELWPRLPEVRELLEREGLL
jgi:hypothetical protein